MDSVLADRFIAWLELIMVVRCQATCTVDTVGITLRFTVLIRHPTTVTVAPLMVATDRDTAPATDTAEPTTTPVPPITGRAATAMTLGISELNWLHVE